MDTIYLEGEWDGWIVNPVVGGLQIIGPGCGELEITHENYNTVTIIENDEVNDSMRCEARASNDDITGNHASDVQGVTVIPTKHEILDNRSKWRLCWHEPVPAKTNGTERTADRIVSMMVYEAIDAQRHSADNAKPCHGLNDYTLLQDFMTIHWAWVVKDMGEHDA